MKARGRKSVNIYAAKTQLSRLVDEAAAGKRIVIAKSGVPRAMLVAMPGTKRRRKPARSLKISYMAPDFDALDPDVVALFEGS
ncbi:MAG: type II toxin-antitoxin system Phd/YefM family antitoxin [Deltaproteobacteria bacterium]|nr:type II toxin-antitoxin system Phd/YefM family antitoxin [Deltaproteobacteria bacterium]